MPPEQHAPSDPFRALVSSGLDCAATLGPDGTIRQPSPTAAQVLGYDPQDMIGKSLFLLLHPDDVAGTRRMLERGKATPGFAAAFDVRIRHKDGSWRRFSILGISGIEEPVPAGIVVYCRDITTSKPAEEAARVLMDIQRELVETLDPAKVPDRIVSSVLWLFRARRAVLYHVDPESGGLVCVATAGATHPTRWIGETLPPGAGAGGLAVAAGRPVTSADLLADPGLRIPGWLHERLQDEGCPAAAAAPMIARGELLGAIVLHDAPGRDFTDGDLRLLSAFAAQAALACQNARLYRKAEERAERLARLHALVQSLSKASGMRATLEAVARAAAVAVGATAAGVFVADPEARVLRVRATSGVDPEIQREAPRPVVIGYGEGLTGRVFESRSAEYVEDLQADTRRALRSFATRAGFRAYVGLPLVEEGTAVGVLSVVFGERRRIDAEEKEVLELLAGHAAIALRRAQIAEDLRTALDRSEASEERFRQLVDGLDAIVWEADAATERVDFVSRDAMAVLGADAEQVSSLTELCERLVHPDDRARALAFVRLAAAEGTDGSAEHRVLAADGRVFWVLHRLRVVKDAEGRARQLRGLLVDVTGDKKTEQRQRLQATMTRVLARAPTLAAAIPQVLRAMCELLGWDLGEMWLLDQDAGVLAWEDMWSAPSVAGDEFGAASAAMVFLPGVGLPGRTCLEGKPLWIPDVAADPEFARKAVAAGLGLHSAFAFPIRARGETTGVMLFMSRDVRPPDPMLLEVVADLGEHIGQFAERKRVEEALAQSQEMLRQAQKMEGLGRMAGGVAHDFNNLLTVIIGRSDLLRSALEESSPLRRHANIAHETAERAAAITKQLLAFSRQQTLEPRVLDLNGIVTGIEGILRRLIREDIELSVQRAPGLWSVRADPTQLDQVIMNLAVNARDAMPEGGTLSIRTANVEAAEAMAVRRPGARPGPHVLLEVSDTGAGMSREVQARIFEPFFTTKEIGRGTGLGLATVYGIVQQHEGWIEVRSQPGHGTTFAVYLPRVEGAADAVAARPAHRKRLTGSETILLAEDETEVRRVVLETLESLGYRVIEAPGPMEALAVAERHGEPIHLLLTDVVMPRMRGPELARQVARLRPEIKVLYISGHADDAVFRGGVLPEGVVLLAKPFDPESLARKVREVLDRQA